jgi:hypothetical protein
MIGLDRDNGAELQRDRLAFHVTQLSEPLPECPDGVLRRGGAGSGNKPTRGTFGRVCAAGPNGHAAAAPLAKPMNARRLIRSPRRLV